MRRYGDLRQILSVSLFVIISAFQSVSLAAAKPVILDNGKSGTSSSGTWTTSIGAKYYGTKSQYSKQSGASYTYKFNLAAPGEYQVFARWTVWSDRGTSVPYDISHVGGTSTIKVNQRQNGGQWRQLGTTWHFGSTATIKLRSLGNGATTNADAIKLVPVNGNIIDPPPNSVDIVYYNNFDNENIGTTYTDQHLRNNWQVPYGGQSRDAKVVANPANLSGNSLSVLFRANEYGSNHGVSWRSDIGSHEELYLAYDVMFENGYDFRLGGKLPGLGGGDQTVANGGYGPPKGNDGWSGRLMWLTQESDYPVDGSVINYMYLPTNGGAYGNHYKWNVGGQRAFTTGKWYALEIRYKMNTPGKSNGILQGWINGELVMDKRSVIYRTVQSLKINYLIFNTFHGGGAPAWAPSHNQHLFFDNVTLSTQPITH